MYVENTSTLPTFAVEENDTLIGFISLLEHFPASWEIHCIAVHARNRHLGIGSRLLNHAETWLRAKGAKFLQVKTVADAVEDLNYAQTRTFYLGKGFTPVEVFPTIWHPGCPALQMIKDITNP